MAVVPPEERAAAASVTNVPRSLAAALPPLFTGAMLMHSAVGWPLVCGGAAEGAVRSAPAGAVPCRGARDEERVMTGAPPGRTGRAWFAAAAAWWTRSRSRSLPATSSPSSGRTAPERARCSRRRWDCCRLATGRVPFGGRPLRDLQARARVFSYMPDEAEPPPEVRVQTLVAHAERFGRPRARAGADGSSRSSACRRLLGERAGRLSRGEKRRLLLFTALCTSRPVIVLDEPLGRLRSAAAPRRAGRTPRSRGGRCRAAPERASDGRRREDRVARARAGRRDG